MLETDDDILRVHLKSFADEILTIFGKKVFEQTVFFICMQTWLR